METHTFTCYREKNAFTNYIHLTKTCEQRWLTLRGRESWETCVGEGTYQKLESSLRGAIGKCVKCKGSFEKTVNLLLEIVQALF